MYQLGYAYLGDPIDIGDSVSGKLSILSFSSFKLLLLCGEGDGSKCQGSGSTHSVVYICSSVFLVRVSGCRWCVCALGSLLFLPVLFIDNGFGSRCKIVLWQSL